MRVKDDKCLIRILVGNTSVKEKSSHDLTSDYRGTKVLSKGLGTSVPKGVIPSYYNSLLYSSHGGGQKVVENSPFSHDTP